MIGTDILPVTVICRGKFLEIVNFLEMTRLSKSYINKDVCSPPPITIILLGFFQNA